MTKPPHEWDMLASIAEEDYKAFVALISQTNISLPISCFHGQQVVEKYMKAILSKNAIRFPFSHDLVELNNLLIKNNILMPVSAESLNKLNPFAVKQRYDRPPEIIITRDEVQIIIKSVIDWCRKQFHD